MKLAGSTEEAVFLRRLSRFSCLVKLEGREEKVYLPNSGRLSTVLIPGRVVLLLERPSGGRQTRYDLAMVVADGTLVSVDSRVPGDLIYEALQLRSYSSIQREVSVGQRRLDFRLQEGGRQCLLEVKSVTLVREGRALFPDCPTRRGRDHVQILAQARERGDGAAIVFVVQLEQATSLSPHDEVDPEFGQALREAHRKGVAIYAFRCKVSPGEIQLAGEIPVCL